MCLLVLWERFAVERENTRTKESGQKAPSPGGVLERFPLRLQRLVARPVRLPHALAGLLVHRVVGGTSRSHLKKQRLEMYA